MLPHMIADVLVRLTILLAAGWLAFWFAAKRNPRWGVVVMRLMIVATLALPALSALFPSIALAILPPPTSPRVQHVPLQTADRSNDEPLPPPELRDPTPARREANAAESVAESTPSPADTPREREPGNRSVAEIDTSGSPPISSEPEEVPTAAPAATPQIQAPIDPPRSIDRRTIVLAFIGVWLAGASILVLRLATRLNRTRVLLKNAVPAPDELQRECHELARQLGYRCRPLIRLSQVIHGPCTAGWPTVVILLPESWQESFPESERRAILAHELSHAEERDGLWDLLAHLALAGWWMHPFTWRIPVQHRLACEHRSDAIASQWCGGLDDYRRMLAGWTLRCHGPEGTAAALAMASRSALMRRLDWLQTPRRCDRLGRRRLVICAALAALLIGATALVQPIPRAVAEPVAAPMLAADQPETARSNNQGPADSEQVKEQAEPSPKIRRPNRADIDLSKTHPKIVHVVDDNQQPIAGATVRVSWWDDKDGNSIGIGYSPDDLGPSTNEAGEVTIQVPQGATRGHISAQADGYANAGEQIWLGGEPTIQLQKGRIVRVMAIDTAGIPLPDALPLLEKSRRWPREFEAVADRPGLFVSPVVEPERRWMRVVAANGNGPTLFSDLIDVNAPNKTEEDGTIVATLRPGIRLEGRLDDSVPRPLSNGCVELYINEGANHRIEPGTAWTWQDTAEVAEDGTFLFESLPPGGHVQLVALVDGFQSVKPTPEALRSYLEKHNAGEPSLVDGAVKRSDDFWPQLFPLPADKEGLHVELPCIATSSVDVTVIDPQGQPIEAATVSFNPNGFFLGGELFIPGAELFTEARRLKSANLTTVPPFHTWAMASFLAVETGADGIAHVRNLPVDAREAYKVTADGFVMPVNPASVDDEFASRYALVELQGGKTLRRTITMERFIARASRELLVVDQDAEPVPEITVTVTELTFEDSPDDWQSWSVQRFGTIVTTTTKEDGIARLNVPQQIRDRRVGRLRVVIQGPVDRKGQDAYVQRKRLEIPTEADGRVVVLTVSDEEPSEPNAFRGVDVAYVDPSRILTQSPQQTLQQLVRSPSLVLLKALLSEAGFDAAAPLKFRPDRNLLNLDPDRRKPVAAIATEHGQRVVVLCDVRPKNAGWDVKPELRSPPEAAFVFDASDGSLIAMVGGWASAKGDYCSITLWNHGGTDDYFFCTSASEDHGPFTYVEKYYRLGQEERPALVVFCHPNATGWTGKEGPAEPLAEFGYMIYKFNGKKIDYRLPGATPEGATVPRKIYWDGTRNKFIGPVTQLFDGKPLYRVDTSQSADFQPLDVQPGDIVVGGGRREFENWHGWDLVVPKDKTGQLRLILVDRSGPQPAETELASSELTAGMHDLQLQFHDTEGSEDQSTVEIRIDPKGLDKGTELQSLRVPVTDTPSVAGQPVARTAKGTVDLLNRPTIDEAISLVWRLTLE